MPLLTPQQIIGHARAAGITDPEALATALAISGWPGSPVPGESGGNSDALGDLKLADDKWGPSVGLWQIRSLHRERGTGGTRDQDALANPAHNARAMATISAGGTNWQPWTVYTSGIYRQNLDAARAIVKGVAEGQARGAAGNVVGFIGDAVTAPFDAAGAVANLAGAALGLVRRLLDPELWRRLAFIAAGVLFVVAGVAFLRGDLLANVKAATT